MCFWSIEMPIVKSCCFCLDTRIGSIIIAALCLILHIIVIIYSSIIIHNWEAPVREEKPTPEPRDITEPPPPEDEDYVEPSDAYLYYPYHGTIFNLILVIISTISHVVLILGVIKEVRSVHIFWIVWALLDIIIGSAALLLALVFGGEVAYVVLNLCIKTFISCCIICVYSHYQLLKDKQIGRTPKYYFS